MKRRDYMAALALLGAMMTGCSGGDDSIADTPQQPLNTSKTVTLKTTVGLDGGADTRALTAAGVKTFDVGERMAVVYNNGTSTVKAVSHPLAAGDIADGAKSATFTFDLVTPNTSQDVTYIYPAAMAGDTDVDYSKLETQAGGTLNDLASKYDLCTGSGAWVGDNLPTATLDNQLAILAITLKNSDGGTDITNTITGLTVSDGTNGYAVTRSAVDGPIYVTIRPMASANITVTATDGTKKYVKSLTGKTYEVGNGYNVSWKMDVTITNPKVGQVIGNDGKNYAYASLPDGVTAVAKICYVSGSKGLALALADESTSMNWYDAKSTAAAHEPAITGSTWKLASKDEWNYMITAAGTYDKLRDGFESVGGTNMVNYLYWSSTEVNSTDAYYYYFNLTDNWRQTPKTYTNYVRACLAF